MFSLVGDWESRPHWVLTISPSIIHDCVVTVGTPRKSAPPAIVKVTVTDLNDNAPRFNNIVNGVIPAYVYENKDNSSMIVQVTAVDPDEGENATVSYAIMGGRWPELHVPCYLMTNVYSAPLLCVHHPK